MKSFWKHEIKTLEALGISKENIDEAQEKETPFKDMLFSSKIIASCQGMTETEIETAVKESRLSDKDAEFDADIIAAANDQDGKTY